EKGIVRNVEARIATRNSGTRVVELSSLAVEIGGRHCLLSVSNDITERRRGGEEGALLQAVTMGGAGARGFGSASCVGLRRVCESTGWVLGQAWIPRPDQTVLECSPAWFATTGGLEDFRRGSENSRFPPGVGLPGRVWLGKQASWVRDVTADSNFPRIVL